MIRWPSWLRSNAEAAVPNGGRKREALAVVLLQLCVSLANRFPFVLFAYAPPQSVAERATLKQMCCRCRTPQRSSGLISTMQSLKKKEKKDTNKQKQSVLLKNCQNKRLINISLFVRRSPLRNYQKDD